MFAILTYLYGALFYVIPVALLVFFGVSLYRYLSARSQNKAVPGTVSEGAMKTRLTLLIVSGVLAGVVLVGAAGLVLLLFSALAYM